MAVLADLDRPTVLRGVALQLVVTLPPVLVIRALTQDDVAAQSNLPVLAVLIAVLAAPAIAAGYVARRRPQTPVLHAAATTALGWMVLSIITIVRLARQGEHGLDAAATILPLLALIEVGVGICTAYVINRSRRDPAP